MREVSREGGRRTGSREGGIGEVMFSGRMRDERNFRMLVDCLFFKE